MTLFERFTAAIAASEDLSSCISSITETEFGITYLYDDTQTALSYALVAEGKGGDRVFDYCDVPTDEEDYTPSGSYTSWNTFDAFINMLKGEF